MSVLKTLRLLEAILVEREGQRGDSVEVVPIVHDALAPEESIVAAVAHSVDAEYVSVAERTSGAPGPLNRALADLIAARLLRSRLRINFAEREGEVLADLPDHPEPSEGLAVLLRLCEILVSSALNHEAVILSYPQSDMDTDVIDVAWELCGLTVPVSPPAKLRFFVPVAMGDVGIAHHCGPDNPVRFAIQNNRLIRRGRPSDLETAVQRILLQRDQPIALFLGAGASASAGVSVGDPIRDEALRRLVGTHGSADEAARAFQAYLEANDRWRPDERDLSPEQFRKQLTLERVLREEFHGLAGRPQELSHSVKRLVRESEAALERLPEGRKALRGLVELLPRLVVLTINFDRLIEDGLESEHRVLFTPAAFRENLDLITGRISDGGGPLPILKLHGTVEDADSLVATVDKTEFGLPPEIGSALDEMVKAAGQALTWVWIGCSMRDADLRIWLGNKDGAKELSEWWVDPLPGESLADYARYLRERQWAQLGFQMKDRLITETSDVFLSRLADHAENL